MTPRREPLAEPERNALRNAVGSLRRILEIELQRVLSGTYGIRLDSTQPEDEDRLSLTPEQAGSRRELLGLWEAPGYRTDLLVREAAFTHANRLIAIRVAEALGLLPESIASGRRSSGFRQLLEVAPLLGSDDDAGYWTYLQICGDELAHDIPRLFDPRNPLLALRPPPSVVDALVGLLSSDALGELHEGGSGWAAPDTLGWTYQFFNSDEERGEMRRLHPQPYDSRELAVRNQFFTPDYVVDFLVQNSLGRRLVEGGVVALADELDLLVNPPPTGDVVIDLAAVRVLDPACGSGHFLLGAYDLLERAWELQGVEPGVSAPSIVASLWGIDIDARSTQVAAAAVIFRARRHRADGDLPMPNVVCARAVPGGPTGRAELLRSVDASRREFLAEVIDQLERAPELGSLLKVEEVLTGDTARRLGFGGGRSGAGRRGDSSGQTTLVELSIDTGAVRIESIVDEVLTAAQLVADRVTSTPAERVLAADGGDALRLVEALSQRYDTVLMNPPFGEPIPDTKVYLNHAYPWRPTKDYNLFALFVGRGLELCKPQGYLGAITSRAGMFLTTFQRWRQEVLLGNDLTVLADLGHKVMHEALVEAAAYVVRPGTVRHDKPATFMRLLREPPALRPTALAEVCRHLRADEHDTRAFAVAPSDFSAIPGSPMAYWMSPEIRRLFTDYPPLEGHGADVRQGLATGDDFRFVRAFWEIDPTRIARTRDETFDQKRWAPFAKGGEYSPLWADIHLVVDYENDGERLRSFPGAVIRNPQFYFRPGLTWPRRTASGFSPRALPTGCVFGDKGPAALARGSASVLLAWLSCRLGESSLSVQLGAADETSGGGASKSYEVGSVAKIPWPSILEDDRRIPVLVNEALRLRRSLDASDETCREFRAPFAGEVQSMRSAVRDKVTDADYSAVASINSSLAIEKIIAGDLKAVDALAGIDEERGVHPSLLPDTTLDVDEEVTRLLQLPMDQLVVAATKAHGAVRGITQKTFVADRRLEVLAHTLGVHPGQIAKVRRDADLLAVDEVHDFAESVASYIVGCAFGRWDVRIGRDPSQAPLLNDDPFAPLPICPPGMLVGPDGLPASLAPDGYPVDLTTHRTLVDEPGHEGDVLATMEAAAAALFDDPLSILEELAELLGTADLRTYLRKRFFKDHLSRYSKSRRKAPIYWPLTVPSRSWTVWLYAPTLSREGMYAAAGHAERRYNASESEIRRLESAQLQASTPNTPGHDPAVAREVARRLDTERSLSEELRSLHKNLARIASTGWTPDLDDGIVVCAAPFADAFLDWAKDPADIRKRLRAGELEWTTAHRWREAL